MALFTIKNIKIKGVSAAVPETKVSTFDYDFFSHDDAETFIKTVGIENRYVAQNGECASDLCKLAADKLIDGLGWEKESIGILSFESVTADYRTPPTSCILQDRLGLSTSCMTFDLPMGCCGFLYSVCVVGKMMQTGDVKRAILLIGDTITRMGSPKDKSRLPLFGDCGTAVALEYDEEADDIIIDMNSYGKGYEALITPHSGFRHQVTPESFEYEDFGNGVVRAPVHSLIQGMDVFAFAITRPPKSIKALFEQYGIDKDNDIDYFLIHQANKMIVDKVVKKSGLDLSKTPSNLNKFANLGGASIPMLMVSEIADDLKNKKLSLMASAFGLGLTWGTMLFKTENLVVPELAVYHSEDIEK